jgi:hypothetical protein
MLPNQPVPLHFSPICFWHWPQQFYKHFISTFFCWWGYFHVRIYSAEKLLLKCWWNWLQDSILPKCFFVKWNFLFSIKLDHCTIIWLISYVIKWESLTEKNRKRKKKQSLVWSDPGFNFFKNFIWFHLDYKIFFVMKLTETQMGGWLTSNRWTSKQLRLRIF